METVIKQILDHIDLITKNLDEKDEYDLNLLLRLKLLRAGMSLSDFGSAETITDEQLDSLVPILNTIVEVYQGLLILTSGAEAQESESVLADLLLRSTNIRGEA